MMNISFWAKIALFGSIVQIFIAGVSDVARSSEIRMDLVTCQPDGMRGKMQAGYDPLAYWIEQTIALERAIKLFETERPDEDCPSRATSRIELEECRGYSMNYIKAAQKCLAFSRRMLALHRVRQ